MKINLYSVLKKSTIGLLLFYIGLVFSQVTTPECVCEDPVNIWYKVSTFQEDKGKIIKLGDYKGDFTRNIGAEQNLSHRGLGIRSSRYTMLVDKGNVVKISEEEIAGKCEITAAENFLKEI